MFLRELLYGSTIEKRKKHTRKAGRQRSTRQMGLELLEDRLAPAGVVTDLPDYQPGQTINITGTEFGVGETIDLSVLLNGMTEVAKWQVTDGGAGDLDGLANGNFQASLLCGNWEDTLETLTASGLTSGLTASTMFTDSGLHTPPNITAMLGWTPGGSNGTNPTTVVTCGPGNIITKVAIKTGSGGGFVIQNLTGVPGDANTGSTHSPVIVANGFLGKGNAFSTTAPASGPYYSVTGLGTSTVTVTAVNGADSGGGGISHVDYFCQQAPPATGSISGMKFEDKNGDSLKNGTDGGIFNWVIQLDNDNNPGNGVITTTTTNASGNFSFTGLTPGTYFVREVQQSGWTQTRGGPLAFGSYQVIVVAGMNAAGSNFGNFENITICGVKYYDANADGDQDAGEPNVSGWTINLLADADGDGIQDEGEETQTVLTGADTGEYCFTNLGPLPGGQYIVTEANQAGWLQTTANPAPIVASSGVNVDGVDFGNIKAMECGGLTIGFWGNKNGLKLLTQADFAGLTALNLRNANGTARDFTGTLAQNKSALDSWLQNANAVNMQYMLSAQLAATWLNTHADINTTLAGIQTAVDPTAVIYVAGIYGWGQNGQGTSLLGNLYGTSGSPLSTGESWSTSGNLVALSEVIFNANTILGNFGTIGSTPATNSLYRKHAEALKIVCDAVNNSNSNNPNSPGPICFVPLSQWHDDDNDGVIDPGEI